MPHRVRARKNTEAKYNVTLEFHNRGLHSAAMTGNLGLIKYALGQGQPINSLLDGIVPLHAACSGGSELAARLLIEQGADVNTPRLIARPAADLESTPLSHSSTGTTALHFAVSHGHASIVRILLDNGAIIQADKQGVTPVMIAKRNGWLECAEILERWEEARGCGLSKAGSPHSRRGSQSTPLLFGDKKAQEEAWNALPPLYRVQTGGSTRSPLYQSTNTLSKARAKLPKRPQSAGSGADRPSLFDRGGGLGALKPEKEKSKGFFSFLRPRSPRAPAPALTTTIPSRQSISRPIPPSPTIITRPNPHPFADLPAVAPTRANKDAPPVFPRIEMQKARSWRPETPPLDVSVYSMGGSGSAVEQHHALDTHDSLLGHSTIPEEDEEDTDEELDQGDPAHLAVSVPLADQSTSTISAQSDVLPATPTSASASQLHSPNSKSQPRASFGAVRTVAQSQTPCIVVSSASPDNAALSIPISTTAIADYLVDHNKLEPSSPLFLSSFLDGFSDGEGLEVSSYMQTPKPPGSRAHGPFPISISIPSDLASIAPSIRSRNTDGDDSSLFTDTDSDYASTLELPTSSSRSPYSQPWHHSLSKDASKSPSKSKTALDIHTVSSHAQAAYLARKVQAQILALADLPDGPTPKMPTATSEKPWSAVHSQPSASSLLPSNGSRSTPAIIPPLPSYTPDAPPVLPAASTAKLNIRLDEREKLPKDSVGTTEDAVPVSGSTSLRARLAAYGETLALEQRFKRGEKQRWKRPDYAESDQSDRDSVTKAPRTEHPRESRLRVGATQRGVRMQVDRIL